MKTNSNLTDEQIKDLIRDLISSKAMAQQMQQCPPPDFLEQKELQIDALRELLEFREEKRRPFKSFCRGSICHGHGDYAVCGSLYRGEYFQCGDCKAKDLESQQSNLAESVADLVISRLDERDVAKVKSSMIINEQFNEAMRELNGSIADHPKIIAESDRLPPHVFRELVNELRDIAIKYHGTQQLRERIAHAMRGAMLQAGNSPVTPDGWIPCSERMPDETQPVITVSDGGVVQRTVYQFCEGVWSDWYEQYDDVNADAFTHWMPLPAAPRQEVNRE